MDDTDHLKVFDARFKQPFKMIIIGPSMAGKTRWVHQLIERSKDLIDAPIDNVVFFYGIKTKQISCSSNDIHNKIRYVEGILDDFQEYISGGRKNTLFIFDDLMNEAVNHKGLINLFTKESHHLNISVIILLQDMFYSGSERKTLFRNADYLILFNTPLDKSGVFAIGHEIMPKYVSTFIKNL